MVLLWADHWNPKWFFYGTAVKTSFENIILWIYATHYGATDPLTLKSNLYLLGYFAVCCLDIAPCVVDIAPDYIVGVVRFMHQVLWVNLELEFKQNLDLQSSEKVSAPHKI